MTSSINIDTLYIENIRSEILKRRISNEINHLKKDEIKSFDANEIQKRLNILESYLVEVTNKQETNNDIKSQSSGKITMFDEIEKYIYKKPWNRLQNHHRIVKIKEYIEKNHKDNENELIALLIPAINNNNLNSMKHVNYDAPSETIIDIPALILDDKTNTYKLK